MIKPQLIGSLSPHVYTSVTVGLFVFDLRLKPRLLSVATPHSLLPYIHVPRSDQKLLFFR